MATAESRRATSAPVFAPLGGVNARRLAVGGLVIVALVLLAVFGWSEQRHSTSITSAAVHPASVSGIVTIEGGFTMPDGTQAIVRGVRTAPLVVTGITAAGSHLVRHLTADDDGRFTLRLPPGTYTVTAVIFGPATRSLASQPHARVTAERGHPVQIRIKGYVL